MIAFAFDLLLDCYLEYMYLYDIVMYIIAYYFMGAVAPILDPCFRVNRDNERFL